MTIERSRPIHSRASLRTPPKLPTLRCGYSITINERGKIIRTIAAVRPEMKIYTRISDGEFGSETV
jgi:exonuclease VII large subunit